MHCFVNMKINNLAEAEKEAEKRAADADLYFAVELKDSGKVIGEIFSYAEATDPEFKIKDTYSPCWMLNPAYKGKGYGYEAAYAYLDFLFKEKGARRIYMYTEDYNTACRNLCEKLGARQEGLFREFVSFVNDENGAPLYENTCQYAILRKEWKGFDIT